MTMFRRAALLRLGAVFLLIGPALAEPSKKDLEAAEKQAEAENIEYKKLQAEAAKINFELNEVSRDMIESAKQIQNHEERISAMEAELEKLREDLAATESQFAEEDESLIQTLAALQNLALKPTEALFVQPLTPVEIIRSAMLMREAVPYLEQNAAYLRRKLESIRLKKNLVEKQVQNIVASKQSLVNEHENLKLLAQKKSKIRNAVEIKSAQTKKNAELLAGQAHDLRDLLGRLEQNRREDEAKRLLAERKAREEMEAKKLEEIQRADLIKLKSPVINEVGEEFAKAKGRLLMPARGRVVTAYDEETAKGVKSKGIAIKTRSGAQVVSPFDGSVIFAAPFRGYGNMIIIEHGTGYLSLLAGMGSIDCDPGQMLLAGEPIGQMPDDDGSAKLYVEIRKDSHPLNPMEWIAN